MRRPRCIVESGFRQPLPPRRRRNEQRFALAVRPNGDPTRLTCLTVCDNGGNQSSVSGVEPHTRLIILGVLREAIVVAWCIQRKN